MKSNAFNDESQFANYITSCYFAFNTLATVGYGEIRPETNSTHFFFSI